MNHLKELLKGFLYDNKSINRALKVKIKKCYLLTLFNYKY